MDITSPSETSAPPGRAAVADSVLVEQVKLLYANLPVSQSVALVNGLVLAIVQFSVIETPQLVIWLACLTVVTLGRVGLGFVFARASAWAENILRWRAYFLAGAAASGLVWGSTALFLYPPDSVVHQVFIAFVLAGMVAGSMTLLAPVFGVFVLFALGALVPLIVRFAFAADEVHYAMAAMGTVFLIAMLAVGKRIHATIDQSLRLRFENRDLIAHLTEEKAHVESMNANLLAAQEALRKSNEALETRVAERTAALQDLDRRKDEFLAMLSHELRNPLAPMTNALYLLKATDPAGAALPHAQGVIERQLQHLVRLVDDLLDVSRINQGRIELRRERLDLADVIRHAVETAQPVIDQGGHALDVSLPREPVYVIGDPIRLAQAISNLLVNAAKYTPTPARVTLTLSREGARAAVTVKDEGMGIPAGLLPRVFDLFVQGDESIARPQGGLGIGLTLVQKLVKLHNGEVTAFSRGKGRGSEFTIYLPMLPQPEQATVRPEPRPSPRRAAPRRVLVVDDNADAANTLCSILKLFGHEVRCVYDGPSTLSAAESFRPDVILLDIGLPGMDGYEVARRLRADSAFHATTLIAVTGYGQGADRLQSQQAGFDQHLTKPIDADMLHNIISSLQPSRPRPAKAGGFMAGD
jgi:signal transduction histidine kinase/ActR/RegA family two-component response regulator